jgi:hypothetical protein
MLFVCENLFGMKTLNLHRKNVTQKSKISSIQKDELDYIY